MIAATLTPPPKKYGVTHWSTPAAGPAPEDRRRHGGPGVAGVRGAAVAGRVVPVLHRPASWSAKVIDVVGLYLAPPENAVVLCVDEKSQIQALDRTAPILPLQPGLAERRSHDYVRHGTTTLFAALEIATGKVTARVQAPAPAPGVPGLPQAGRPRLPRRRHRPELHLVMDNYAAHKHPKVKTWLAANPRVVVPLHPDPRLLDEPGRGLVLHHRTPSHPPRHLRLRPRPQRQDPRLHRRLERPLPPLRLDQDRRPDPRRKPTVRRPQTRGTRPPVKRRAVAAELQSMTARYHPNIVVAQIARVLTEGDVFVAGAPSA